MKKQNKKTSDVAKTILVAVAILFVLVGVGLLYRSVSTGKAVEINVPSDLPEETINLDLEEEVILNLDSGVNTFNIKLKTAKDVINTFNVKVIEIDPEKDIIQYFVSDPQNNYVSSALLTSGDVSGQIYLPTFDDKPDLEVSYLSGKLYVKNLNYIVPQASKFIFYDSDGKELKGNIFNVKENDTVNLIINVTSNVAPEVAAIWEDGTELTEDEFASLAAGGNFSTYDFTWTAVLNDKPKVLILTAVINKDTPAEKVTVIKYIFAPEGTVYVLAEENYPEVLVKKLDNKFEVSYILNSKSNALSLPCGSLEIKDLPANIVRVYSYDEKVKSWTKSAPANDLTSLEKTKAYLVKLDKVEETNFTVTCDFSGVNAPETKLLPTLKVGWNLVGVGIYESVPVSDLKTPAGKTIFTTYLLKNDGVDMNTPITELEPGKAYWVKAQ